MKTIQERLDTKDNGLNLLRWLLAASVIFDHTFPLGGFGPDPQIAGITWGPMVVIAFFAISGFLITMSRFQSGFFSYVWRRALRIIPAFWACLVFTAFVAAAIGGAVRGGWTFGSAADYVWTSLNFYNYVELPAKTLEGAPYPYTWNGSLWTLRFEVFYYIILGFALTIGFVRRQRVLFPLAFAAATVFSVGYNTTGVEKGPIAAMSLLVPAFLAGAVLYAYRGQIPLDWRWVAPAAVFVCVISLAGYSQSLTALPLAYLCIWFGVAVPRSLRKLGSRNDYSYGIYVYGFPSQQLLVLAGVHELGHTVFILVSYCVAIPLSMMSWFLVEKPALSLKGWAPIKKLDRRFGGGERPRPTALKGQ